MSDTEVRNEHDELALPHSRFFEKTFGMPSVAKAFLRKFLRPGLRKRLDIEKLTVAQEKFMNDEFRELRADRVYEVPIIGVKERVRFHIVIEHKSTDDHSAIFQVWKYVSQMCIQDVEKRLTDPKTKKRKAWPKGFRMSPVIPIILHHGNLPFTGEIELAKLFYPLPGAEKFLPHQRAILVDLSTIEAGDLPRDANAPELNAVLLIMKVIRSKKKTEIRRSFSEILRELEPYSRNPMYYELIYMFWHYTMFNAVNMTRTDYVEMNAEIHETLKEGDENMTTMAQMLRREGKAEGEVGGKIDSILAILDARFGEIPEDVYDTVTGTSDLSELNRLTRLAAKCSSLDEFGEGLF